MATGTELKRGVYSIISTITIIARNSFELQPPGLDHCPVTGHALPLPEAAADHQPDGEEQDGRHDAHRCEGGLYVPPTVGTAGAGIEKMRYNNP